MNVVLGLGGSDESTMALRETVERTRAVGDDLTVAVVDGDADRSPDETHRLAVEAVEEAGLDADVHRLEGDPGSSLVEFAEREGADQLVIGGGRLSPMGKIRLGPITEFVLLNATMSVKLVR